MFNFFSVDIAWRRNSEKARVRQPWAPCTPSLHSWVHTLVPATVPERPTRGTPAESLIRNAPSVQQPIIVQHTVNAMTGSTPSRPPNTPGGITTNTKNTPQTPYIHFTVETGSSAPSRRHTPEADRMTRASRRKSPAVGNSTPPRLGPSRADFSRGGGM